MSENQIVDSSFTAIINAKPWKSVRSSFTRGELGMSLSKLGRVSPISKHPNLRSQT